MSVIQPVLTSAGFQEVAMIGTVVTAVPTTQNQDSTSKTESTELQNEEEKRSIYGHPLFPLMALLFEKCEMATQTPDCPTSDSFDVDIQAFVHHQEKDNKPFFSEDSDLDALMVKAIQVLRIHLLELEKVNELCKDFCTRYIACLKGKLQSEQLLRIDSDFDDIPFEEGSPTSSNQMQIPQVVNPNVINSGNNIMFQQGIAPPGVSMATINQGQIVSGGTVYQMVQTPQGLVAQPIQIQSTPIQTQIGTSPVIHGSTPLSQIGVVNTQVSQTPTTPTVTTQIPNTPSGLNSGSDDEDISGKKKNKRGVLPKPATQVMKTWLFQHIVHPYPTEDEKRQIATQTNLTLLQVNNWFINARRRILQPMLDASNPEQIKAKKSKPQNRPLQRFWPESIANIQPQIPGLTPATKSENEGETTSTTAHSSPNTSDQIVGSGGQVPVTDIDSQKDECCNLGESDMSDKNKQMTLNYKSTVDSDLVYINKDSRDDESDSSSTAE